MIEHCMGRGVCRGLGVGVGVECPFTSHGPKYSTSKLFKSHRQLPSPLMSPLDDKHLPYHNPLASACKLHVAQEPARGFA